MKSNRINALTGLRAFAMITVFCSHLNCLAETPFRGLYAFIDNGKFGVNFFLVLSGFVLALGYSHKLNIKNPAQDIQFIKKRVSKIYIPYIITTFLGIPCYIYDNFLRGGSFDLKMLIIRLLINTGMIQSAIPFLKYSTSINYVAWFISTMFIIYLFTPAILRFNNRTAERDTRLKLIFRVFALLAAYCCVYMIIRQIEFVWFAHSYLNIIYVSPLIRIFPFLLGIVGYSIYCHFDGFRFRNGSYAEIMSMAMFVLWWIAENKTGLPTVVTECISMLISLCVMLVFAFSRDGAVSVFLSKEKIQYLGNISLEFYLIHYMVINYGMIAAGHFGLDKGIAVLPLTVLFFAISLYGAGLIHSFSGWLKLTLRNKTGSQV